MNAFERIAVIGLGYIGLPTATVFALAGKNVIGVDTNPDVVAKIQQGQTHFHEPDLARAVQQAVRSGNFFATETVQPADVFIIAVPTPFLADHQPDLSYIQRAVQAIAPVLRKGNLVVLESTSPVGTTEKIAEWLQQARPDLAIFPNSLDIDIDIAYCPERVLPGKIMAEIYQNDRIIGGLTPEATQQAVRLYQLFAKGECLATDARTAEMCKLTENSFRDVNIAFANELSIICGELNINVWELIRLANHHPRVNILQPGAGVGGHCIAVDPWFIVSQTPQQARLIKTARQVNETKPEWVLDKIKLAVADCANQTDRKPSELAIACFGLAFKADVGDLRQSPALSIAKNLAEWHKGKLLLVEPNIEQIPDHFGCQTALLNSETALQQADILVMLVDHAPFKSLMPTQQWIVDTKGIWQ